MRREFSIVRVKREAMQWAFPVSWDDVQSNPLAGPFSQLDQLRLDVALGCFPFARRTTDGRRAWRIAGHGSGYVEVWITSDGSLFIEGHASLNLICSIFSHLSETQPNLLIEDRITGVVHNERTLLRAMRQDEVASAQVAAMAPVSRGLGQTQAAA